MAYTPKIPHPEVTPFLNQALDAVPELWNTRFAEATANFQDLDARQQAAAAEVEAARHGGASLADTINAIAEQIGGIGDAINGMASPVAIQRAVNLDLLYRGRRIAFELFAAGYELRNHADTPVVQGVMGDDSLDVASTGGFQVGEDYVLSDGADTVLVRVTAVHSDTRLRLSANLSRAWGPDAILTGSTLRPRPEGGMTARPGSKWVSRAINLGDDRQARAVIIRRALSAAPMRLYFRDAYTQAWTERPWSLRRSGGGTTGVPDGYADYEYVMQMRGDGFLRVETDAGTEEDPGEDITVLHIVGLGSGAEMGGYVNPEMRPAAPSIVNPADGDVDVTERPTLTISDYSSPAGNGFSSAQFQLSTDAGFASVLHDSAAVSAMTYPLPAGVLVEDTEYHLRARVIDVAGLVSGWSETVSFTTKSSFAYVNTPVITTPSNGQTEIPEQPTLQTAAFATTGGAADTHAASQWQIRAAAASWAAPLHDTGETSVSKTGYTPPAGVLSAGQAQYVLRVRHKGTTFGWSEWSSDISFTTKQQFATILGIVLTAAGGGAGAWQRVDENFNAITTTGATFNNHPVYAGVVGQTIDGQAMVRVPKFYLKTGAVPSGPQAGKRFWMISDQPVAGFKLHPAFMNGGAELDQYWVGKYQGFADGSKMGSQAGKTPLVSIDFPTMQARAAARNAGGVSGFGIWSVYQLSAIQLLCMIEMGGSDSQTLIGQGHVNNTPSGVQTVDHATVAQATWRGIVGLWGNIWQAVDGLRTDGSSRYEVWDDKGSKTYKASGKTAPASGTWPVTMSTDTGADFDLATVFAPSTTGAQAAATYPDMFYQNPNCVAYHGGYYSHGAYAGLFYLHLSNAASNSTGSIGSRLAKV